MLSAALASAGFAHVQDAPAEAQRLVEATRERWGAPAISVAVSVGDEVVLTLGLGLADVENGKPAGPNTVYRIASVSKPITAVAVMQLAEGSKLELGSDVRSYVPELPEKRWPITVMDVVTHRSGIRHYAPGETSRKFEHFETVGEAVSLFAADPLRFQPGSRFGYTTYGYTLLQGVIEGASEQDFEAYLRASVFGPAGMENASLEVRGRPSPGRAVGYRRGDARVEPVPLDDVSFKYAGGGMLASAEDLVAFARALMRGDLLEEETLSRVMTPPGIAFGVRRDLKTGWLVARHSGRSYGFESHLAVYPESEIAVAVLTNQDFAPIGELSDLAHGLVDLISPVAVKASAGRTIALEHATVWSPGAEPAKDQTVLVEGERITWVGPAGEAELPGNALRVDASGRWIVPGLSDLHVHVAAEDLPLFVASGVTTIRDLGGSPDKLRWRDEIRSGARAGPDMVVAGTLVAGTPQNWSHVVVSTPEEARATVVDQHRSGYDAIKVYDGLSKECYDALVEEAAALGIDVVGHVPGDVGLEHALDAGQRSIEHAEQVLYASFGRRMDVALEELEPVVDVLVAKGATLTATLASQESIMLRGTPGVNAIFERAEMNLLSDWTLGWWSGFRVSLPGPETLARRTGFLNAERELVRRLHERGGSVLVGTDAPNPLMIPGVSVHDELDALVRAGVEPEAALTLATKAAAEFLGRTGEQGAVRAGCRADLLLVDGDPRADLERLRAPRAVILRGRLFTREQLEEWLVSVERGRRGSFSNWIAAAGLEADDEFSAFLDRYMERRLRAVHRDVDTELTLLELAEELEQRDRLASAIQTLELAVDEYPDSADSIEALAAFSLRAGDREKVSALIGRVLDIHPDRPSARALARKLQE